MCIYAYVSSAQHAVNEFYEQHNKYPSSLNEIDKTMLDYHCGLQLDDLQYENGEVSCLWGNETIYPEDYYRRRGISPQ